jgi:dihydrofolate synthase/folylpolyglutamate synthase
LLERLFALETFGIKLGLENIGHLCAALNHPERAFQVVHVGGTNGKGSVTAMAHAALVAAGVRAARYTSPHLVDLRERFVVGRTPVDPASLEAATTLVLDCADALVSAGTLHAPPTFFEATTAIAFELFRRARVEVAVLEVGLGGRFDATNVIAPVVAAITSIGLDHQQYLGETIETIAFEKAGIIKSGVPVVIGALPAAAEAVVRRVASEQRAPVLRADADAAVLREMSDGRSTIEVTTAAHRYRRITLSLRGEHQVGNAIVALRLLEEVRAAGVPITFDAIEEGLTQVEWPARLELFVLRDGRHVLLDAAHNADGAIALASYLAQWHPERPPLVFAAMRDKDITAILRALLPVTGIIVATAPPTPRAADPDDLAASVSSVDPFRITVVERDPARAVHRALESAPLVCVAGSIFLAGAVRDALHGRAILH